MVASRYSNSAWRVIRNVGTSFKNDDAETALAELPREIQSSWTCPHDGHISCNAVGRLV